MKNIKTNENFILYFLFSFDYHIYDTIIMLFHQPILPIKIFFILIFKILYNFYL